MLRRRYEDRDGAKWPHWKNEGAPITVLLVLETRFWPLALALGIGWPGQWTLEDRHRYWYSGVYVRAMVLTEREQVKTINSGGDLGLWFGGLVVWMPSVPIILVMP